MEAAKVTIRSSKLNATVKNGKKATQHQHLHLQHFNQFTVKHFTYFNTENQQK